MFAIYGATYSHRVSCAPQSNSIGRGSLSFAASCLESAFSEARSMDRLQLQSTPCLGWVLLPEIQQFVSSYAEEFIKEIAGQVRQETWAPVVPTYFSVLMPGSDRYNSKVCYCHDILVWVVL